MNVRPEIIKFQEGNIGSTLVLVFFLVMSPQSRETKAKINKWYYIKLKNFFTVKKTIDKTKMPTTECKKYLQMIYLIRGYIQNIQRTHTTQHQRNKQPD